MRETDFTEDRWGTFARTPDGRLAFKPKALPPVLSLNWPLVNKLDQAARALATLAGTARGLPNPHLLIYPFIRREAVLSSRIEGTQASLSDVFLYELQGDLFPETLRPPDDVQEVRNYVVALEYGLERLKTLPLSLRLIRELHERLMTSVRGHERAPGEFRRTQVFIGAPQSRIEEAAYVPPPVPDMLECLDALEKYLHAPSELPPLIRLALVHYQFEAIHPFLDGNGRVGRLLISLMMIQEGLLPSPLLYLSAYFERRRADYYACLQRVSQRGAWADWIEYFLDGVTEQSGDAAARGQGLIDLMKDYEDRVISARSSSLLSRLARALFQSPFISISHAARILGVSHQAAAQNVEKLVSAGILYEVTGRKRDRIYVAKGILDAIEKPMNLPPQDYSMPGLES